MADAMRLVLGCVGFSALLCKVVVNVYFVFSFLVVKIYRLPEFLCLSVTFTPLAFGYQETLRKCGICGKQPCYSKIQKTQRNSAGNPNMM